MSHRVLVLEPDPDLQVLLALTLRSAGYECNVARSEALHDPGGPRAAARRRRPPAAIVLELPPPCAAGIATLRAAKARWSGIPLVALVGDSSPGFHAACRSAGAGAVLCHPFWPDTLTDAIRRLLADGPFAPAQSLAVPHAAEPRPMPKRILVVEDDGDTARLVEGVLRTHGYDVVQADTVAAARLHLATEIRPHLAMLDVALPDGSGIELCHELKATWPEVPVLLTCERLSARGCAAARATGCAGLMPKPFDLPTLTLAVRIAVGEVADRRRLAREEPARLVRHAG